MMSPAVSDLLQRVIIQSDSFLSESYHPMTADQAQRMAGRLSTGLGCPDLSQLCLQDKDTFQVLITALNVMVETQNFGSAWMPVVDSTYLETPFLPSDPEDMLMKGEFSPDIDVMIGANKEEGILFLIGRRTWSWSWVTDILFPTLELLGGNSSTWDLYRETFNTTGPKSLFMIPFVSDIRPEDVERSGRLVEFYLGSSDNISLDNAQALIDMFTDSGKIYINIYISQSMWN